MLKKSRLYFSAIVAAVVLASLLVTSNVKACEEPPQTFLTLYMNSDLIVLAKYESNGEAKKTNEDEYGYSLETPRNLAISKVYKGRQDLENVSFIYFDYVPNPAKSDVPAEEYDSHESEGFFNVSKMKIGGEYLVFLKKNSETGEYGITDYVSGIREADKNLSVYEKNMTELAEIAAAKKNQHAKLAEWMVKNIEDPLMRDDAISDLSESFYGMKYPEESGAGKNQGPFVVNEGYGIYTVGVAAKLTPAQMNRISAALYPMLQQAWFAEKPEYANYGISTILRSIDKSKLALHAYNTMHSVSKDDVERKNVIMEFLTGAVEDETLSSIFYEYMDTEYKIKDTATDTPEGKKQLKVLQNTKALQLKNFDARFKTLFAADFAKLEARKTNK